MAELTLHFELDPNADVAEAARGLKEQLAAAPEVETSVVDSDQTTRFVTGAEILAAITLAGQVAGSITAIVTLLEKLQQAAEKALKTGTVQRVLVDIGLRSVPIEELTDADKSALAAQVEA
jgi:peptidyl-tRNA hydrolase